ncbi:MAG: glycosyltransferase, partial [Bacteroidaceae bacterium]|nr:glycosyltransferase [Bacteroidaceae bacterium]
FHKPVYEESKLDMFRKASLSVLPSMAESFGLVVAESLACGTPVITTKGTPWEKICGQKNAETGETEGQCGWWIETGSDPLAEAIRTFLDTPEDKLREMGRNGRALMESQYCTVKVADELINIYNDLKIWK